MTVDQIRNSQVYPFLRSKNWDTRIAAGQAIEAIAAAVPIWKGKSAGNVNIALTTLWNAHSFAYVS